ncbi:MAG: hypothetical protein ACJA02_000448 [Myxococcota bacterium]|jgi:hypothetical protein
MNKRFRSLFIIIALLFVQTLTMSHASQHGFEKHSHDGKICDIFLSADHNKLLNSNPVKLVNPTLLTFQIAPIKQALPVLGKGQNFEARAPPFYS